MACKDCGNDIQERADVRGACRVCVLIDNDVRVKRTRYCATCKAYICETCRGDVARRTAAFSINIVENVVEKIKELLPKKRRKKKDFPTDDFGKEDAAIADVSRETVDRTE